MKFRFSSASGTRSCGRFGPARLDGGEIEVQGGAEDRIRSGVGAEEALLLAVALHPLDDLAWAAGALEIPQRLRVDREEAHGGAVLRRHVGDGRAVGQAEGGEARTVEFDELVHHSLFPEHLGGGEHQVGRGGAQRQAAGELHPYHLGDQHEIRLPQHHRLRLDPAHAPAHDAEAVDHGGVRVGADEGVGVGGELAELLPELHGGRQVLEVHLVHDAGARRHHPEVAEGALGELEELVPLDVPLELELNVEAERILGAVVVHLYRVIDHQVAGHHRVDLVGIALHPCHRVAHGGEVDDARHAGEILEHHARRHEGDLRSRGPPAVPSGELPDVLLGHHPAAGEPERILEQDANGEGKAVQLGHALAGELGEAVDDSLLGPQPHRRAGTEGIDGRSGHRRSVSGGLGAI
jgi:hypothetical protein